MQRINLVSPKQEAYLTTPSQERKEKPTMLLLFMMIIMKTRHTKNAGIQGMYIKKKQRKRKQPQMLLLHLMIRRIRHTRIPSHQPGPPMMWKKGKCLLQS